MEGIWINGERGKCDKDGGTGTNVIKMEELGQMIKMEDWMIKWEGGQGQTERGETRISDKRGKKVGQMRREKLRQMKKKDRETITNDKEGRN